MRDERRQGLGLAKVVWDLIINIGYTSMEEIGFHPKGSGKSLESFRVGRDTRMVHVSHGRACPGMKGEIRSRKTTEEAGIVAQNSSVEAWARAMPVWTTDRRDVSEWVT